ncbi:MAG: CHAD domain-containing protein, partial [Acidobacteriaceae bacterium]|nr:CHAD domain-containing protein [Acidobacteriaceae bacterium]
MPYRLKAGEPVPEEIRRIASEEIESAVQQLSTTGSKRRDKAIHEARKSIKKVRGLLKLMRPELDEAYRRENTRLRDIGRQLSEFRDAHAMIETFDTVAGRFQDKLQSNSFDAIRQQLAQNKQQKEQAGNVTRAMKEAGSGLRSVLRGIRRWPLQTDGF